MNILFYTPVNFRCRDIESLARKFKEDGHRVILLSLGESGELHRTFSDLGMENYSLKQDARYGAFRVVKAIRQLITFCIKNKIAILFSHLEPTNFVSVMAQYFISARVIIYRHHIDVAFLQGFSNSTTYKLTYRFANEIISVSQEAKEYMISNEGVAADKITHINLGYNFSSYHQSDLLLTKSTRERYAEEILLVTAGSLSHHKRQLLSIELVRQARALGLPVSLLIIGKGIDEPILKTQVQQIHAEHYVSFVGYTTKIIDYLAAADWLIHPSNSESSCVVVKEAALVELPVMICKGVGDFDNYMLHEKNGIVLDRDNFVEQALLQLQEFQRDPKPFREMGKKLKIEIMDRFAIDRIYPQYKKFTLE